MRSARSRIALLLLGGAGTRLWPVSTERKPKQFIRLFGEQSQFQLTLARVRAAGVDEIVILGNAAHEQAIQDDMAEMGVAASLVVLEPERRDSGPAIAAGVACIHERRGPDAVVLALPSDHLVRGHAQFTSALDAAVNVAADGWLVTFGIDPGFASTDYGYIERGAPVPDHAEAFVVSRFHEKPDRATAETYLRSDRYAWNSGMFVFSAALFAAEAERLMPDIWSGARAAVAGAASGGNVIRLDSQAFPAIRKSSIDYALMEKTDRLAVFPAAFDWSDIGTWDSVYAAHGKDGRGNVLIGDVTAQDCSGSLLLAHGRPLAVAGLKDMIVVTSPEGAFAAPRGRASELRGITEERAARCRPAIRS